MASSPNEATHNHQLNQLCQALADNPIVKAIARSLDGPILFLDHGGRIIGANNQATEYLGVHGIRDIGETVSVVDVRNKERNPVFQVLNPGVIAPEMALNIFHRSFSTKAELGRGIGTYSMKLLGEKYLKGKVSFESNEENGTVFQIELNTSVSSNSET